VEAAQHPDLAVVQAEAVGGTLKVEAVRELHRTLSLTPYQASHRVGLLLRFEEANPSAANALLKTLEEPPPNVVLLLTAESAEGLLPTVVSRCEVLRLRPLSLELAAEGLQTRWGLPEAQARLLSHLSGGRPGYALALHQNPDALAQRETWLDDQRRLLSATRVARFAYAETLARDKTILREVIQVWMSFWRDVFLRSAGAAAPLANLDRAADVEQLARRVPLQTTREVIQAFENTIYHLDRNVNTRLAAEVLMLSLPFVPVTG